LCYGISADHDSWPDFWYFYVNAWINKENFDYWLSKIIETIDDFVKQDVTQEELNLHISYIIWRLKVNQDMIQQRAYSIWINYLFYKQLETIDELVKHYKQVTIDEINKIKWLLSQENLYTFYCK
jgi:predicted Zn-dependent peptidase